MRYQTLTRLFWIRSLPLAASGSESAQTQEASHIVKSVYCCTRMVRLHVKVRFGESTSNVTICTVQNLKSFLVCVQRSDKQEFLFETTVEAEVSEVIKQVVEINNLKHKIERLRLEGGELAKFGPALSPEDQEEEEDDNAAAVSHEEGLTIDPTGRRSGQGMHLDMATDELEQWEVQLCIG